MFKNKQIPVRVYAPVKCVLQVDIEFSLPQAAANGEPATKHFKFPAGSMVTVDLNENIAYGQGVHFSVERDEYAIPN